MTSISLNEENLEKYNKDDVKYIILLADYVTTLISLVLMGNN